MKTKYAAFLGIGTLALAAAAFMNLPRDRSLVVHEWGTFTSLQGSDGVPLKWNPLESSQLPKFVYSWDRAGLGRFPSGLLSRGRKSALVTLQRMETPVIYFYTDKDQTVDVTVRFPKGGITEWYPQAPQVGPSFVRPGPLISKLDSGLHHCGVPQNFSLASIFDGQYVKDSLIHWPHVKLLPAALHSKTGGLPADSSGSHYFAARETDSAYVETASGSATNAPPELEKFLFYRGVGNFSTPLSVSMPADGTVCLANSARQDLAHVFFLEVKGDVATCLSIESLKQGERKQLKVGLDEPMRPLATVRKAICEQIERALISEGLFPREARAMVTTWQDSWFQEQGARVLYVLPRGWTDETLPIRINPTPRQLVRVMVGRAELITRSTEQQLILEMTQAQQGSQEATRQLKTAARQLGRFAHPVFQEVLTKTQAPDDDRNRLLALLYQEERR